MTSPLWHPRNVDSRTAANIVAALACPSPIASLLASRGLRDPEDLRRFFKPNLTDLHPPALMRGMKIAVRRIREAVRNGEPILIYGDYDVDGTIATVLLKTAIERIASPGCPAQVTWHVPHRIREGYGMQGSRLAEAAEAGIRLVISVDTGIRAFAAAAQARALGLDLIVTDHHLSDEQAGVPDALAVLNPVQPGCPYPFKQLCGAAVAFKLAHALLLRHVQDVAGETGGNGTPSATELPDRLAANAAAALDRLHTALLPSLLKLVAIATIADSVPLVGENRTIAMLGLRGLSRPVQPGLRALLEVAAIPPDRAPTAAEVGFRIAPRINAAGRMDIADDVIELFLTRSPARAQELASRLNNLNDDRRATERQALDSIDAQLALLRNGSDVLPAEPIVLDDPSWHRGVLGILASRIVDRTGRPALVLTHESSGEAHGSGRSVPGFHLLDALTAAHAEACETAAAGTLFHRFGGHAHAVGFSLPREHLEVLRQRLRHYSRHRLTAELLSPPLHYDAEVQPWDLTPDLADWLRRCGPFGNAHPEPILLTRGLTLVSPPRLIQERHLCLTLTPAAGLPPLQALGWTRPSRDAEPWPARAAGFALTTGSRVDLLYRLAAKSGPWFTGLELELVDLAPSGPHVAVHR